MPDYRRRAAREAMSVRLDVNGMMADAIGDAGVSRTEVESVELRLTEIGRSLRAQRAAGAPPFGGLPQHKPDLSEVKALAAQLQAESDTLVVLGVSGSTLGAKALIGALETTRRVIVADTIDPVTFGRLLDGLDLARTTFNVISKSGETTETMAQFLLVRDLLLRQLGAVDYAKRVVITTDADAGALRQIVHDEGFRALAIPPGVPARFSVLSVVGLFPAAVAGVRVDELLAGAAWMDERCQADDPWRNPGVLLGTLLYLADTRHRQNVVVLRPYTDRLHGFSAWCAELWAESLGKAETLDGTPAHSGQTPVTALGTTDQLSQLQLYAEGPADKVVILMGVEDHGREIAVPAAYADLDSLAYLGGTGLGQLLAFEQRATELALRTLHRPVLTLRLPQINAFTLGQVFHLFEIATVVAAALYRVDPFTQPGTEEGKRLTYAQAGRRGFESKRAEVEHVLAAKRPDYIL